MLNQSELDAAVQTAISRWESTGLTPEQVAILRGLKFDVATLSGIHLGEAAGCQIRLSTNGAGRGWFSDSSAQSDSSFANPASATRRCAAASSANVGRVDLLTAVMHEMGHAIGLADSYLEKDRENLMYGYLIPGERRLPARGQGEGVLPDQSPSCHYLSAPVNIGTLPPGKSVIVSYRVTINNPVSVGTTQISSQGTVSGSNFASVLTDDPNVVGASDPTVTQLSIPPVITSGSIATFTVGTAGTFTLGASGAPAPTFSVTGTLPTGVSLSSAGVLSGTAAAGTGGVYPVTFVATNGVPSDASQNFTLNVNEAPTITSATTATFTVGSAGSFTVTTGHVFPAGVTLSVSGNLPGGVSFTDNGDGTATLSGTPAAGTGGNYSLTFTGHGATSPDATQSFTLKVNEAPTITSANHATFKVGVSGTFAVTTGYDFPISTALSLSGALPGGVSFTDNGNGTASIAGTPNAGTGGVYSLVITGNNGVAPNASQTFTLTVDEAPAITSANSASFKTDIAGSFTVITGPHFPIATTLSQTGALPSGVNFTDNGDGTAILSGTAAAGTGGTYPISFTANNGITPNGTQNFTLTVDEPPAITSASTATFTIGVAGSVSITTSGFPTSALSESGALPAGVTFTDNGNGTATLSGTPAAGTNATYNITITANNGISPNATQNFTLVVKVPVSHFTVTGNPANVTAGSAFNVTVTALDDTNATVSAYNGTVHFTSSDGQAVLPPNSALTNGVGVFSVTLRTAGNQTVSVNDTTTVSVSGTSSQTTVGAAAADHFALIAPASATAGSAFNYSVTALDAYNNTAVAFSGTVRSSSSDPQGVMPANVPLTSGTGTLSATFKTAGSQSLTATDASNAAITGTSNTVSVGADVATHFSVSAPASATAGTAINLTLTALDQFNNTATGYGGTVHFTSSDAQAALPVNSALANGTGVFSATLKTSGTQNITATDTVSSSINGTSNNVSVGAAVATHFSVIAPSSATAGSAFNFTVTALDQFNNTATGYAGTVHYTSGDAQAVLPANGTLTSGTGALSATFKTSGTQTLTATDTVSNSIAGTSNGVTVSPAAATHFSVSAPASAIAGTAFNFTVTALDAFNNTATAYSGTTHLTSSDAEAALPADTTLASGVGTLSATLKTAGVQTLTATDILSGSITGTSNSVTVAPGAATHFTLSAPASATAGTAFNFTVTALDAFNNTATGYAGTAHFTSNDGQSVLPADSTLTSGAGTFSATLRTSGTQTLRATDTATASITGTSNTVSVSPAEATHFAVSAPASATAGTAFNFTVTALDQFNNTATGYAGTAHFTSGDGQAVLPADTTLAGGVGTLSATLKTAGNQTLTATDTASSAITGTSNSVEVGAASATHFALSAPASSTAGTAFNFTVTALDPFSNTATGYTGTVHWTSSDAQAALPADSTLASGVGTFSATLRTAGNQTLTATDTASASITGTSGQVTVSPAAATHFALSAPSSATAGTALNFTVTALDPYNNTATSYAGTAHFASGDAQGVLPADSALTNGAGTFSATLKTAGAQILVATDTATSSITGTSNTVTVGAAAATHFTVSAPASATAGDAFNFTVTALDAYSNTAVAYSGTVHSTSTDLQAVLPADSTLVDGVGSFSATLKTAASQTITATDTETASITGISGAISVAPAEASRFAVATPATASAGVSFNLTVTAQDPYGNTATAYAGTAHFTSSDLQSVLPADSTLANGTGTFSATLKTAGAQSITATDSAKDSVAGTGNLIEVSPGPATHLSLSAPANVSAGLAFAFSVSARDAFDNVATGYAGTLHFTSTEASATLPADAPLANGAGSFSATLHVQGTQSIAATDTITASLTGTTADINVLALPPVAQDDEAFTTAKLPIDIDVLANDSDPGNDTLQVTQVTQGKFGAVSINPNGTLHYVPNATILGTKSQPEDSFTYTIANSNAKTATATVTVRDRFLDSAGAYDGLLTNAAPDNSNLGYLSLTLSKRGAFTGKLRVGGVDYPLNGSFDPTGHFARSINRGKQPALALDFVLDSAANQVVGIFSGPGFVSDLKLEARASAGVLAGSYTLVLPANPSNSGTSFPQGNGYATMTVQPNGLVKVSGKLGDCTAFASNTFLHADHRAAIYAGLYSKAFPYAGSLSGMLQLENLPGSDADGTLLWFKPAHASDKRYSAGFSTTIDAVASKYRRPALGANALNLVNTPDNAKVAIGDDSAVPPVLVKTVTLGPTSHVTVSSQGADHLSLTIVPATGLFQGGFYHPVTGKHVTFNGVLFQKGTFGAGVYLGTTATGYVELSPK
jgi:VCBS repeat-containing protein